jgi:hypothetical protein
MYPKKDVFTENTLLNIRGWSQDLIAEVLTEPDMIYTFPRDSARPTIRYYLRERVFNAEDVESIANIVRPRAEELERRRVSRREDALKELQEAAACVDIGVRIMSTAALQIAAIENFYARMADDQRNAPDTMDRERLRRIYINYAAGRLVDYDAISAALPKPLDRRKIYAMLRERIEAKILSTYPGLATPDEAAAPESQDAAAVSSAQ